MRRLAVLLAVLLVSCGGRDATVAGPAPLGASPVNGIEAVGLVESSGVKPGGFRMALATDPKRDENGAIVATSPLTVEFDACRSTSGEGAPLYFYFDWDFDHAANVWGGVEACRQVHTYRSAPAEDPKGNETFRTNVCVANGDLRDHDRATYVSCREVTIVLARQAPAPVACGVRDDVFGGLLLPAGSLSAVGSVIANDCDPGGYVSTGTFNGLNVGAVAVSFPAGTALLSCNAPGPFFAAWSYTTTTGTAFISAAGNCT